MAGGNDVSKDCTECFYKRYYQKYHLEVEGVMKDNISFLYRLKRDLKVLEYSNKMLKHSNERYIRLLEVVSGLDELIEEMMLGKKRK